MSVPQPQYPDSVLDMVLVEKTARQLREQGSATLDWEEPSLELEPDDLLDDPYSPFGNFMVNLEACLGIDYLTTMQSELETMSAFNSEGKKFLVIVWKRGR